MAVPILTWPWPKAKNDGKCRGQKRRTQCDALIRLGTKGDDARTPVAEAVAQACLARAKASYLTLRGDGFSAIFSPWAAPDLNKPGGHLSKV
jgi:hypothetical protein